MVRTDDVRELRRYRRSIKSSIDEIVNLYETSEIVGKEFDSDVYGDAQEELQEDIEELVVLVCGMANTSDHIEIDDDGELVVDLPKSAVDPMEIAERELGEDEEGE